LLASLADGDDVRPAVAPVVPRVVVVAAGPHRRRVHLLGLGLHGPEHDEPGDARALEPAFRGVLLRELFLRDDSVRRHPSRTARADFARERFFGRNAQAVVVRDQDAGHLPAGEVHFGDAVRLPRRKEIVLGERDDRDRERESGESSHGTAYFFFLSGNRLISSSAAYFRRSSRFASGADSSSVLSAMPRQTTLRLPVSPGGIASSTSDPFVATSSDVACGEN